MSVRFEAPAGVRFTCSQCGDCCRSFEILLGPGEAETLQGLDWSEHDPQLAEIDPVVAARDGSKHQQLRRREDGACIYLGDDDRCRIHQHFGAETKPMVCRLYPFGFYPVGERVAVDVSFACRAVSEGQGAPLERQIPQWTRWLEEHGTRTEDSGTHRLDRRRKISAELLWELEHSVLGLLDRTDLSLLDRLRSMLQFVRIATTGDPTLPSAGQLRQAMATGIPGQMARQPSEATLDKTQRAVFDQWLFLALNPITRDPRQGSAAERKASARAHDKAVKGFLYRRGHPQVAGKPLDTTFDAIRTLAPGLLSGVAESGESSASKALALWLRAKIVGQRFLLEGGQEKPLIAALCQLLVAVPMVLWTAKALAAERGAPEPAAQDLRVAIRRIDQTLGRIPLSRLPRKQAKVYDFVMGETDVVEAAINDLLAGR